MDLTNFSLTNILSWIIFGLIVGFIVHLIDPGDVRGGIIGTTITGILGALLGGFLANLLLGLRVTGFNLQSFLIAAAGALLLAFLQRLIFRENKHIKTPTERLR